MSKRKHPRRKKKKRALTVTASVVTIPPVLSLAPPPTLSMSTIRDRLTLLNQRRAANG